MQSDGPILITGGARGIGRACALLAARRGHDVAIGYRGDEDAARATVAEIEALGRKAIAIRGDVAIEAEVIALFERVDRAFGTLAGLVNSAGISTRMAVAEADGERIARLLMVNVAGTMIACREAARRMAHSRGGKGGAIVNVSSMAAVAGGRPGAAHYAGSKGAIDSFTMGFAKEVARDGIRVNAVRPGVTVTDMTASVRDDPDVRRAVEATIPMGRAGEAEEIAAAVLWLLSDEASFITGSFIDAGGGGFAIGAATG